MRGGPSVSVKRVSRLASERREVPITMERAAGVPRSSGPRRNGRPTADELRNRLALRYGSEALREVAPLARGRLIDIGCGEKPNEPIFAPYVEEHVGLDHEGMTNKDRTRVDVFGSAYDIPVEGQSFDTVLCTAVLEHLEEPKQALVEARRVLKPDGVAIYTVPLFWGIHEAPRDFFRYTEYGLRHLFGQAGFRVEIMRPLGGFWITVGQLLCTYLDRFRRGPMRWIPVISVLMLLVQAVVMLLNKLHEAEAWTWSYLVVARPA